MSMVKAYAAKDSKSGLGPWAFERRSPGGHDVDIDIAFCGVCHSDLHQVRDEWGGARYPMVPGHEIVGTVARVGNAVTKFRVGDRVGVGCLVDACRTCDACKNGLEQYCENGFVGTYNAVERDGKTITYGGYSERIVTDEAFVLKVPEGLDLARTAPLLCAGITTYSPLKHWKVGKGHRVGVVGLGGLGHMAVKLASAMGAEVTVLSTSPKKKADALALGAHNFVASSDAAAMGALRGHFDFVIDTVSAPHDYGPIVESIKRDGNLTLVGAPPAPAQIMGFSLIMKRRSVSGSLIGGIAETQEMLDFCAKHNVLSDIELLRIGDIDAAYERMIKGDVKYRFVIDIASLRS